MNKDLIKYGLLALGAYLIYKYIEDNGGLSAVLGGTASAASTPAQIAAAASIAAKTTIPPPPPPSTAVGTTSTDAAGNIYSWTGTGWILKTAAPVHPAPATPPAAAATPTVSQQMLALSGTNSRNMDEWCFYYGQATGQPCPVDPGAIDPGVYSGAGITDRATPTDIGTWLAIMQNQAPSAGLSAFFGPGSIRYTPAWLM